MDSGRISAAAATVKIPSKVPGETIFFLFIKLCIIIICRRIIIATVEALKEIQVI